MRIVLTAFIFFAAATASGAAPAGLMFSPSACDFGELGPVETASRTVIVSNACPVLVRIARVRACCGAKATISKYGLAPSETAELKVSVTSGTSPGPFRKTVTVVSDDPGRPLFALSLAGRVAETGLRRGEGVSAAGDGERPGRRADASPRASSVWLASAVLVLVSGAAVETKRGWTGRGAAAFAAAAAVVLIAFVLSAGRRRVADADASGSADAAGQEDVPHAGAAAPGAAGRGERMGAAELADGNERLEEILRAPELDPGFPGFLASVVTDRTRDGQWRNHCLQYVPECMMRLDADSADRALLASALASALAERSSVLAGTALLGYARLSERTGSPTAEDVCAMAVALASDASSSGENIVTALRVGAERHAGSMLGPARYWARNGEGEFVRCVAISAVRDLGGADEAPFLRALLPARTKAEEDAVAEAVGRLEGRR